MNEASLVTCFTLDRPSSLAADAANCAARHRTDRRLTPVVRQLVDKITRVLLVLLLLVAPTVNAAIEQSTAPIEILRVVPAELRAGDEVTIVIGVYRSDIDPREDRVAVMFGEVLVRASAIEETRAGFAVTASVPQDVPASGFESITVRIGRVQSDPFRDFQFAIEELEIVRIVPQSAAIGQQVVLQLSRALTDEEMKSARVNFQRLEIAPIGMRADTISIIVPKVDSPTPVITVTANDKTSRPYLDFLVEGLAISTLPTSPDNSALVRIISLSSILVLSLTIGIIVVRKRRKEAEIKSRLTQFQYELETGQSGDLTLEKSDKRRTPDPPPELIAACASGNCVLFAGSGLGAQAGYPTWREALNTIIRAAEDKKIYPSDTDWPSVLRLLRNNEVNTVSRIIRNSVPKPFIFDMLSEMYSKDARDDSTIGKTLATIPFSSAIRTSFDSVVETAFLGQQPMLQAPESPTSISELNESNKSSFVIYKLSGTLRDPNSPILTDGESRTVISENQPLVRFLQAKFMSEPFLFLGASVDTIEQFLASCDISGGGNTRHFALMPNEEEIATKVSLLGQFGIQLLVYDPSPGFPGFSQFVNGLAQAVEQSDIEPAPKQPPSQSLKKVTLQNVGPFRHLELPLHPGWNVLLGNNGCGKTTILRAVSAALCGDKAPAKAAIARLLRTDEKEGQIVLELGNRSYTTLIRREGKRVTVRSRQVTPLEAGGMLVLGFPALRGAIQSAANAPDVVADSEPADVDVADVLPIVTGEIDSRMDSLTQWIIDTESRGRDDHKYAALLDKFFALMDDLTPGVKLKFGKIDKSDWKVLVDTDDGRIPIDLLSQGMNSIFSWAGYLMQRLQEVFPNSEDVAQEQALVLVDEIDAHMHPKWQQLIIQSLKTAFPNIQFLATTHSPLITTSLEPEELIIAKRQQDDGSLSSVIVTHATMDPGNYQAHQLLTSPLFDLDTSGDIERYNATLRYTELSSKDDRSQDEEAELAKLAKQIDVELPTPAEREEARIAWEAIQRAFEAQIENLPAEKKLRVTQEAKVRLQENVTGSRRP